MFWGHFLCSWRKTDLKWCRRPPKHYLLSLSFPWPRDLESRIFDFGNLRSGQFCDHSIIRQRGKNQIPHLSSRSGNVIKIWVLLCYWSWSRSKFSSVTFIKVIWVGMTSSGVTNRLLLIIQEWKQLQIRAWSHCVSLVKTHRLICNMTYGSTCDFTWTWHEVKFWADLSILPGTFFNAPWREKHDGAWI